MKVTSIFLPPEPAPPVVTLTITMTEEEASDLAEVVSSWMPSRIGTPFARALADVGIRRRTV